MVVKRPRMIIKQHEYFINYRYVRDVSATDVATAGPPKGKDHRKLERYFKDVLKGARIVEGQCSKDVIFE